MNFEEAKRNFSHRKKGVFRLFLALLLSFILAVVLIDGAVAAQASAALSIDLYNLSYSESTYVLYAVSCTGIDTAKTPVELLFWNTPDADFQKGSEDYSSASVGNITVSGKKYAVFYSNGIAPKNLGDTIYCRAFAETDSGAVYSAPVKYSALQYLVNLEKRPNASQADKNLALALRNYGAAAQTRFNYHTDSLSSNSFYSLALEGARLEDGFSSGLYPEGSEVTLFADASSEDYLINWFDGDNTLLGSGQTLSVTLHADTTVRAVTTSLSDVAGLNGITFSASDRIYAPYFVTGNSFTVEAMVYLPSSYTGRGGVILGNYKSDLDQTVNLEIHTSGRVRLYFEESPSKIYSLYFDTDVRGNTAKQIAVTIPAAKGGTCRLYVDGVLAEEKTMPCAIPAALDRLLLGGDYRDGNAQYFKGTIYSLAIFDGVRSAAQIAADAQNALSLNDPDLVSAYFFYTRDHWSDYGPAKKDLSLERSGFSLEAKTERYSLTKTFSTVPLTYEALIDTDADVSNNKGCTIIGNYNDVYVPGITFRVYLNGKPGLCLRYDTEHQDQFFFPESILGTGRVHVAFSIDDTYVYGYLNGKLVLKKAHCGYLPDLTPYPFSVGGDNRTDNSWWFRDGDIYSINLFSEYRSAEQIARDVNKIDTSNPALMLSFNFENSIEDQSPSENQLVAYFYDDEFTDPDTYDFTFACVGDTQSVVNLNPDKLHNIYDFILENKDEMKIVRVIGLGDMTEDNVADQWELVQSEVFRLDDEIPYTVNRGNHDLVARTPDAEETRTLMFGYYFDNETYQKQYDGCFNGPANTYKRFSVCDINYLLLCLDYGADDDALAWASSVVENYPDDKVIITTHAFLFHDGTTLDANDICPPSHGVGFNDCDVMWDQFVSKYENIILVICGHDPSNEIVVSQMVGENGNLVTCCLIDPQHTDYYLEPTGLVALLHFSNGGSTVTIDYYSTIKNQFYKTSNKIVINNVGGYAD